MSQFSNQKFKTWFFCNVQKEKKYISRLFFPWNSPDMIHFNVVLRKELADLDVLPDLFTSKSIIWSSQTWPSLLKFSWEFFPRQTFWWKHKIYPRRKKTTTGIEQGRIHSNPSRVRMGRGNKEMGYPQPSLWAGTVFLEIGSNRWKCSVFGKVTNQQTSRRT